MGLFRRYSAGARFYDVISGERAVYRAGRVAAVELLGLSPGDVVLDLGCGTGLNLPLLSSAVGPTGLVIGLDLSPEMLAVARRRGLHNVVLERADATQFDPARIVELEASAGRSSEGVDAVISTYAMSVFDDWHPAWDLAKAALRPGGSAAIVDMQPPTGFAAVLSPLARLACALGGADITARPWRAIERDGTDVERLSLRGGHVQVAVGVIP
ncbi:MAG: hypothetical protein RI885_2323 [Actinomycetota bacterium]|jgi:demethylmenaquinone methyltransferase/2-methoxy-6-polyprenyl-1,4-benzoquinol methylase